MGMPDKKEIVLQRCKHAIDNGEPIMDYSFYYEVIDLLKEQEAIPPGKESDGNPGTWASWWYVCVACGREIDYHDRFCRCCGRQVKWE